MCATVLLNFPKNVKHPNSHCTYTAGTAIVVSFLGVRMTTHIQMGAFHPHKSF